MQKPCCITTILLILKFLLPQAILTAQIPQNRYRIVFYNLENLFHPDNDSIKRDDEFTPEGLRYWSEYRYREKYNRMAKAILSIGEWDPPTIVGVEEVENRQVLEDLIHSDVLRKFNYDIIHYESPDRRGIDVGFIYRQDQFSPIFSANIPVKMPGDQNFATRDILLVKGTLQHSDTIFVMVCHWPSRYGGQAQSEPKRIQAAQTVKDLVDSIQAVNNQAAIIIGGDFNDEPENTSLKILTESGSDVINLMSQMSANEGSHRFHGEWSFLDQIIISSSLIDNKGLDIYQQAPEVHRPSFMLEPDEKFPGLKPFRSYTGMKYNGGFSDHLPVYIDLIKISSH